jgi:hypothetical protein
MIEELHPAGGSTGVDHVEAACTGVAPASPRPKTTNKDECVLSRDIVILLPQLRDDTRRSPPQNVGRLVGSAVEDQPVGPRPTCAFVRMQSVRLMEAEAEVRTACVEALQAERADAFALRPSTEQSPTRDRHTTSECGDLPSDRMIYLSDRPNLRTAPSACPIDFPHRTPITIAPDVVP